MKYKSGYKYQLVEDYAVKVSVIPKKDVKTVFIELSCEGMLVIKKGYAWDGPSVPTIDTANFIRGSLVHDALYQLLRNQLIGQEWRDEADKELRRICLQDGMSKIRAWWVYHSVRKLGGPAASPESRKMVLDAPAKRHRQVEVTLKKDDSLYIEIPKDNDLVREKADELVKKMEEAQRQVEAEHKRLEGEIIARPKSEEGRRSLREEWAERERLEEERVKVERKREESRREKERAARYANTCFTRQHDHTVVTESLNLQNDQWYDLRVDIGPFSSDSVVQNPSVVPSVLLPRTEEDGHWLEVVLASDDFEIPKLRHYLFLPRTGPSWVCSCIPGSEHSCTRNERQPYLFIPVKSPTTPGVTTLRLGLYYEKNLVQSQEFTVEIGVAEKPGNGHHSRIDYTLTHKLTDMDFLPSRNLNILLNQNTDGSHKVVINADLDDVLVFNIAEEQMRGAINAVRETLRSIHFEEYGGQLGTRVQRRNLFDDYNSKTKEAFIDDLRQLAPLGADLWKSLMATKPDRREKLRKHALIKTASIQVSRTGGSNFVFPWDLVYDITLDSDTKDHRLCRLINEWDGMSAVVPEGVKQCPYESEHKPNTICPFGFWGYKHSIEQPPSIEARDLPLVIQVGEDQLDMVIGLSTDLDDALTNAHINAIRTKMSDFNVIDSMSRKALRDALANPDLEIVYFYCHGRHEKIAGTNNTITYLEIGDGERITPGDIIAWDDGWWMEGHWRETSPLIFINGCHTTDITPEALVNFVDNFAGASAAGVIGTEITIDQRVASEAAEEFFDHFKNNKPVSEAIRRMRMRFLSKGNLLGLAYTAYCSGDLKLHGGG